MAFATDRLAADIERLKQRIMAAVIAGDKKAVQENIELLDDVWNNDRAAQAFYTSVELAWIELYEKAETR